jgi:hypothetical protein
MPIPLARFGLFNITAYEWRLRGAFSKEQISLSLAILSFFNSGTNEGCFDELMSASGKFR